MPTVAIGRGGTIGVARAMSTVRGKPDLHLAHPAVRPRVVRNRDQAMRPRATEASAAVRNDRLDRAVMTDTAQQVGSEFARQRCAIRDGDIERVSAVVGPFGGVDQRTALERDAPLSSLTRGSASTRRIGIGRRISIVSPACHCRSIHEPVRRTQRERLAVDRDRRRSRARSVNR
jgi:hypothetical protein